MAITKSTAFPIRCPALDTRRFDLTERMEEPGIPKDRFHRTLEQFTVVNRLLSRYRTVLKRWVISDMERAPSRQYTLLDVGAGACDIDRWLSAHATRRRLQLRILAVDHDPRVAAYCQTASREFSEIKVRQEDAVGVLEREPADYVFANHLLHHLSDDQVISFLQMLDEMPVRRYVLSDIARSCFAWLGFRLVAPPLAPRSYIVADGLRSILRAFTVEEVTGLVERAGLRRTVRVIPLFPSRFVIIGGRGQ